MKQRANGRINDRSANPPLQCRINEDIVVRLKWGQTEYKGTLVSVDSYMNIQLSKTEEFIDGKSTGSLGEVLIRCAILFYSVYTRSVRSSLIVWRGASEMLTWNGYCAGAITCFG